MSIFSIALRETVVVEGEMVILYDVVDGGGGEDGGDALLGPAQPNLSHRLTFVTLNKNFTLHNSLFLRRLFWKTAWKNVRSNKI